jgi:Flp pilus assembly pilin Flp
MELEISLIEGGPPNIICLTEGLRFIGLSIRGFFIMKKNHSGQGLVEYALILVFVAIVVVVVVALLGPAIQEAFKNVIFGIDSAAGWIFCSNEHAYCSFTGTKEVRYGENGHYNYLTLTNGTACENSVFGDPIIGTVKKCYYR